MDKFMSVMVGVVFMVMLAAVCILSIVYGIRKRAREASKMQDLAGKLGFSYTEWDDELAIIKLFDDPVARSIFVNPPETPFKQNKFAYDIMRGVRNHLDVCFFNWTYLTNGNSGTAPRTEAMSVVVLQNKDNSANPLVYYEPGRLVEASEIESFLDEAIRTWHRAIK